MFPTLDEFFKAIRKMPTDDFLEQLLFGEDRPHAFSSDEDKNTFFEAIKIDWRNTEHLSLAGTGAWRYSLNPKKNFREFSLISDVDVINISDNYFHETWDHLRQLHRDSWYDISAAARKDLLRNGENIYCGFVSPKWIPDKGNKFRFAFETRLEKYATKAVGYRTVTMMFFRNATEVKDYYRRGVEIAKSRI